jgi:hypothetical protein
MKKMILTPVLAAIIALGTTAFAQEQPNEKLGLPGDNLNLYAVMDLFQKSPTLEGFEKSLNDESSRINNLDLNGDNKTDYITVSDYVDGNTHSIVLRDILGPDQSQDVAVFTVQKLNNGSVDIQLIGDEALYGKNYIIEPVNNQAGNPTPNPGYQGGNTNVTNVTIVDNTPFDYNAWPLVSYLFMPDYSIWHSRYYWGFYPSYWHPWRPFYWDYYYGYYYNMYPGYYARYRHWDRCRWDRYHDFYYSGIRAHSVVVNNYISEGRYNRTYSRPAERSKGERLYRENNPGASTRREVSREPVNRSESQRETRVSTETSRERNTTVTRQDNSRSRETVTPGSRNQGSTRSQQPAVKERSERPSQAQSRQRNESVRSSGSSSRSQMSKPSRSSSAGKSSSGSKSGGAKESKSSRRK